MLILVVDDDDVTCALIERALQLDGHEVVTAANGRQALEILGQGNCRIVISDWMMPEVSGITLCRSIREGEFGAYVYIILLSSNCDRADVVAGLSAGADDFMTKPFDLRELRMRIRAAGRILGLETRDATIFTLAKSVEARDVHSGNHLERVRRYTRALGERLATDPKFRGRINNEYLHLLIDDALLLKPGRLTADEFEVMKTHTIKGAETLEAALSQDPNSAFLQMARDIASAAAIMKRKRLSRP